MTRQESECWDSAQRWHEKYLKTEADNERLRAALQAQADEIKRLQDRDEATAAPLRDEIERLKTDRNSTWADREYHLAEIERQRQYIAELEDLHCFKELRAEVERLTALVNDCPVCRQLNTRAALPSPLATMPSLE